MTQRPMCAHRFNATDSMGGVTSAHGSSPGAATDALDRLFAERERFLGFVRRRVRDRDLAEDILQSAYVQALRAGGELRDPGSAPAWFYRILRNAVIDWYRSRAAESDALERLTRDMTEDAVQEPSHGMPCGCVEAAIAGLNERYASVLREVELGEGSISWYAASHGMTRGNAAVRAHRARAALRKQLLRCCGDCAARGCIDCGCPV